MRKDDHDETRRSGMCESERTCNVRDSTTWMCCKRRVLCDDDDDDVTICEQTERMQKQEQEHQQKLYGTSSVSIRADNNSFSIGW